MVYMRESAEQRHKNYILFSEYLHTAGKALTSINFIRKYLRGEIAGLTGKTPDSENLPPYNTNQPNKLYH